MPPVIVTLPTPPVEHPVIDPPAKHDSLSGRWFYTRPAGAIQTAGTYPIEYVELVLTEEGSRLQGRYTARYLISDRPISPVVSFQFGGRTPDAPTGLPWTGPGGAAGRVSLKSMSENRIEVTWSADRLGTELGLISGRSMLVRRVDPQK